MSDLARRVLAVNRGYLGLGNETFEAEGALFVRNRAFPQIHDANCVARATASSPRDVAALLERVEREYKGMPYRRFDVDFETAPEFEAVIAQGEYELVHLLAMVLEGDLQADAQQHDIRLVEDEAGWRDYAALHEVDWNDYASGGSVAGDWTASSMFDSRRAKSPPMQYWVAYVDGTPAAYAASWAGIDGVGQVEDLFTLDEMRHRGLATALIQRGVQDARARGAGPIAIVAGVDETPKRMYEALGFRPIAVKRNYWRRASPDLGSGSDAARA